MKWLKRKQLAADGWRPVPKSGTWINRKGEQYNEHTKKVRTLRNVPTPYGRITTEKAVLWLFKKETPRAGIVYHLNGDKSDKTPENLKYAISSDCHAPEKINRADLLTAIRCYWNPDRKETADPRQYITRFRLRYIVEKRYFDHRNAKQPFYRVFADWLGNSGAMPVSAAQIAAKHGLRTQETLYIIAGFLNRLTSEIKTDIEAGRRALLPYPETKREKRIRETQALHMFGIKRPAPVRFPKDIKAGFEALGILPPQKPDFSQVGKLSTGAKLVIWLLRADDLLKTYQATTTDPDRQTQAAQLAEKVIQKIGRKNFFK